VRLLDRPIKMTWSPVDTYYYSKLLTEQGSFLITESGNYLTATSSEAPTWSDISNVQVAGWTTINTTQIPSPSWTNIPTY